jgi:arginyl-tRNA synthetase
MLKQKIEQMVLGAIADLGLESSPKLAITYPDYALGDYSSNVALILSKEAKIPPMELAKKILAKIDKNLFESVDAVSPGFINFRLKTEVLLEHPSSVRSSDRTSSPARGEDKQKEKILVEYFQPNIAMHIGLLRNAIIGDALKRMLQYLGNNVESDTHMGDWGTQFGLLLLGFKKYGDLKAVKQDPINELNKLYIRINEEAEKDEAVREEAKHEFVKLEKGDKENRKTWKQFVDWSMETFSKINPLMDILPFDHNWPESFFEDKMPDVLESLKVKNLLKLSEGAQIVDLEEQGLGVAVIVKSDGGTTYLLRDLATFIYRKSQGFAKQFYVVDSRQAHTLAQTFAILKLLGELKDGEAVHIDYGFISFKGSALSTRKGNMVLVEDLISEAEEKVAKIIQEKNPDLKNKDHVTKAVAKGAIKYFDLSHNRHSDIEFDWERALDFEGDSGPYIQYAYARLSSILRKAQIPDSKFQIPNTSISNTERELLFKISLLPEIVKDAMKDFLPNILANYLYSLAGLINRFYHESPVLAETDEEKKALRLKLIESAKKVLGQGLGLLGIEALEEM